MATVTPTRSFLRISDLDHDELSIRRVDRQQVQLAARDEAPFLVQELEAISELQPVLQGRANPPDHVTLLWRTPLHPSDLLPVGGHRSGDVCLRWGQRREGTTPLRGPDTDHGERGRIETQHGEPAVCWSQVDRAAEGAFVAAQRVEHDASVVEELQRTPVTARDWRGARGRRP